MVLNFWHPYLFLYGTLVISSDLSDIIKVCFEVLFLLMVPISPVIF